jgi:hypothetical protein
MEEYQCGVISRLLWMSDEPSLEFKPIRGFDSHIFIRQPPLCRVLEACREVLRVFSFGVWHIIDVEHTLLAEIEVDKHK